MYNLLTESPNGTHYHIFTNMRSWGRYLFHVGLFISQMNRCHPLPLILPQMLLKPWLRHEKEKRETGLSTSECSLQEKYGHLRPLVLK